MKDLPPPAPPHPVDNFQVSDATREYGQEFKSGTNRGSPQQKCSPKFFFSMLDDQLGQTTDCIFRIRISGIQCRNLQPRKFRGTSDPFVEFYWANMDEPCVTPILKNELNPTWKGIIFTWEYCATITELKEQKLIAKVYSDRTLKSKSLIGSTEIDLYTIATGPVHHDHHLQGCETGRLVFNCYMEQYDNWDIGVADVGIYLPAISDDLHPYEGHDFQEDASLPLQKYAINYKCTIGMNETFYIGNSLKPAMKKEYLELSSPSQKRFNALKRKVQSSSGSTGASSSNSSSAAPNSPSSKSKSKSKKSSASSSAEENNKNIIGVNWTEEEDALPNITRYSTFDEFMSATLKLEIRSFVGGRGEMSIDSDMAFILLLEKYQKEQAEVGEHICLHEDLPNTNLFGQCWLSFECLFEDAIQEHGRRGKYGKSLKNNAKENQSQNPQWITSRFEQSLELKGHHCGFMYGTIIFKKIPVLRQLRSGVISEHGMRSSSSVIVGLPRKHQKKGNPSGFKIPEEAQRLLDKVTGLVELMSDRQRDDKEVKIRKATKILQVLQTSHKASMLSWVYSSSAALDETKNIFLRLWEFLLENIRVRDYTLRNIFYELLFYLLKRAELGDLSLLGFDAFDGPSLPLRQPQEPKRSEQQQVNTSSALSGKNGTAPASSPSSAFQSLLQRANPSPNDGTNVSTSTASNPKPPNAKDVEFGLKLRAMLLETKCCVLQAVSIRGVLNNNFMFFVARMLSIICFRLPSFGVELYQLWALSYTEPVEELAAEFQINADADLFAMDGLEAHLDWRRFHKAIYDQYGSRILRAQEEDAEDKYEVTPGACKARLSRLSNDTANQLNILLVDQWLWYVLDTLAVLNQKIGWTHLPGYAQILKVFFVELGFQQHRSTGPISPSLYKLSCTMLSNPTMINPMTKFLLSRTNVYNVPCVISSIEILGVWMYMIRSWRVRLTSYRLTHLETNDRWNFHRDIQYSIPSGDEISILPPAFDYRFLSAAIRILLAEEQTLIMLTTLEFLVRPRRTSIYLYNMDTR